MTIINALKDRLKPKDEEELLKTVKELELKKRNLQQEIKKLEIADDFQVGYTYTASDRDIMLKRLPLRYIGSVFHVNREMIIKQVNLTFEDNVLERQVTEMDYRDEETVTNTVAMICDAVLPTSKGPVLQLSDPYRTIRSFPLEKVSADEAMKWIGRLLFVRIVIKKSALSDRIFELKGVKVTEYTLMSKIEGNKDVPLLYHGERFGEYKDCTGLEACKLALTTIEKYLRQKNYGVMRIDEEEIRFRKDDVIEILFYKDNQLQYIYKKDKPLHKIQRDAMLEKGYYRYEGDLFNPGREYERLY